MGQEFEDIFESSLKTEKYVWSVKCEGEHSGVVVSTTSQPSWFENKNLVLEYFNNSKNYSFLFFFRSGLRTSLGVVSKTSWGTQ